MYEWVQLVTKIGGNFQAISQYTIGIKHLVLIFTYHYIWAENVQIATWEFNFQMGCISPRKTSVFRPVLWPWASCFWLRGWRTVAQGVGEVLAGGWMFGCVRDSQSLRQPCGFLNLEAEICMVNVYAAPHPTPRQFWCKVSDDHPETLSWSDRMGYQMVMH